MGEGAAQLQKIGPKTPIAAMAGIGPKRAEALNASGIRTIGTCSSAARYGDHRRRSGIRS